MLSKRKNGQDNAQSTLFDYRWVRDFCSANQIQRPRAKYELLEREPVCAQRDALDNVMTWIFTGLALVGLILQIIGEIFSDRFPERQYTIRFYAWFSFASLLALVAVVFILTTIGNRIAKRTWMPLIVAKMTDAYNQTRFIIEHDGWRADQMNVKDSSLTRHATVVQILRQRRAGLRRSKNYSIFPPMLMI